MTIEEAIKVVRGEYVGYSISCNEQINAAECVADCAEKYLKQKEAWEIIKDNLSQQIHHNLDAKEKFEIGSISRIECNTTASVLAEVIYLIDKHLSEVSE